MVDAEKQFLFREVHHQGNKVFTSALDLNVVSLGDSVDSQVHFGSSRHRNGRFFAKEEIGVFTKGLPSIYGVVVG
jgi:hypothetical protein